MKNTLKLIFLLVYAVLIFFIDNFIILGIIATFNICLMLIFKVPKKKALYNIYVLSFFIIFTVIINIIFSNIRSGILIGLRLVLVCNITYTYKHILSPVELAQAIENLLVPLRVIGVNPKDISLIINICITFIPILSDRFTQIKYALKSKGIDFNGINKIKNFQYILKPLLYSTIKRTNELEYAIKAKGYTEN